jgi:hypothetical protein
MLILYVIGARNERTFSERRGRHRPAHPSTSNVVLQFFFYLRHGLYPAFFPAATVLAKQVVLVFLQAYADADRSRAITLNLFSETHDYYRPS